MSSGSLVHQDLQASTRGHHPHQGAHRPPGRSGGSPAPAGLCAALGGHSDALCQGPACSPPPHAHRPGPLLSLHCLHSVSESNRNVHGKKARGKPAARRVREQGEGGRPQAHLRSAERPDPTAQSTSRAQSTAGPPPPSAGTSELQTSGAEGRPGTGPRPSGH